MDQTSAIQINNASIAATVDEAIMRAVTMSWRKVAMVIAMEMQAKQGVENLEIAKRVKLIVAGGKM